MRTDSSQVSYSSWYRHHVPEVIEKSTVIMEQEPLLKKPDETAVQGVQKSNIRNLLLGNLILFVLTLAAHIQSPVQSQYLYRRVSADIFGNNSVEKKSYLNQTCYLNTSDPGYILQEKAQEVTAEKQMQFTILKSTIAIFSTVLLGAYSDSIGRKFLFAGPLTGHFLKYSVIAAIIYWDLDINFFFLSEGIDGLSGGYYSILLASYAYAADNTPATGSRTMGIAFVEFFDRMGGAASSTAAGYFIQDTGFFYPQLTAALLCLVDIFLVLFLLPERTEIRRRENSYCISPLEACKRVFGFYILDGSRKKKACFILAMMVFIFTCLPGVGAANIDTLFKLNLPFCWSPEMIGYFSTASSVVQQVIGVPLTRLLQYCFIDEVIAIVGCLAIAGGDVLQGFANTNFMMYGTIAVKIPAATMFAVLRSILSRMAPPTKQGSLFASIAAIETLCAVIGTPIFSNIYQKTVVIWRGFVFIIMAGVHVLATVFLIIFIFVSKYERDKRVDNNLTIQVEGREEDTDDISEDKGSQATRDMVVEKT